MDIDKYYQSVYECMDEPETRYLQPEESIVIIVSDGENVECRAKQQKGLNNVKTK